MVTWGCADSCALVRLQTPEDILRLVPLVAVCAGLAAFIRRRAGLGEGRAELTAVARATLQLGAVGLFIAVVLVSWPATLAFVTMMVVVAAWTSARRIQVTAPAWMLLPVALGSLTITAGFAGHRPPACGADRPRADGRHPHRQCCYQHDGHDLGRTPGARRAGGEVEAGLSIGLLPRDALLLVAQDPARLPLVPGLDRTRTVGLVTLPGAFVGTLLGGATPLQAAALQLVVLAAILLVQSVAVARTLELVVRQLTVRPEGARP